MIKAIRGENDLQTLFPIIANEWHPSKNGSLYPADCTCNSGRTVWWMCKYGHEWRTSISNRTRTNSQCPYCSGKRAIVGVNDLASTNPILASEWHPSKNGDLTPRDVMSSSKKKIWWICNEGHEWEASLDSRKGGHGCPYCSGRRAIKGKNDLVSRRPDIAKLWHPTKNSPVDVESVTVASGVKYWWLGDCGHEWQTKVSTMCDKTTLELCPVCTDQNRTSFPEQAIYYYCLKEFPDTVNRYGAQKKEIDIFIPTLKIGFEYDGLRYHSAQTTEREKQKNAYFLGQGITIFHLHEHEDFEYRIEQNTVFYRPWDNYSRLDKAIEMLLKMAFASCGKNISLDIDTDRDNAEILSLFMKRRLSNGFAARHPQLLKEWHPSKNGNLDPWLISEKSNQRFWWLGACGHEWEARVNDRVRYSTGCPICSKEKQKRTYQENLVKRKGSLSQHFPELSIEWEKGRNGDITPEMVTSGSNKKVFWCCSKCGHIWQAVIANRTRKGQGCPKCRKTK